jgi:hypothetical protein
VDRRGGGSATRLPARMVQLTRATRQA